MAVTRAELGAGFLVSTLLAVMSLLLFYNTVARLVCSENTKEYLSDVCLLAGRMLERGGIAALGDVATDIQNCWISVYNESGVFHSGIAGDAYRTRFRHQEEMVYRRVVESKLSSGELDTSLPCPVDGMMRRRAICYRSIVVDGTRLWVVVQVSKHMSYLRRQGVRTRG